MQADVPVVAALVVVVAAVARMAAAAAVTAGWTRPGRATPDSCTHCSWESLTADDSSSMHNLQECLDIVMVILVGRTFPGHVFRVFMRFRELRKS